MPTVYQFRLRDIYRGWATLPQVLQFSFDKSRGIGGADARYMRDLLRPGEWVLFGPPPGYHYRLGSRPHRSIRDIAVTFGTYYELPPPFAEAFDQEMESRQRRDKEQRGRLGYSVIY